MSKKILVFSAGTMFVTIFLVIAYLSFNFLGITQSRLKRHQLIIQTGGAIKDYDGTALSNDNWGIIGGKLYDEDRMEVTMSSSIVFPGVIDNEIFVTIYDINDKIVTDNYKIVYNLGTLTIRKIPLIIKSDSSTIDYDGSILTNPNWELLNGTLLEGHQLHVDVDGEIRDVGAVENKVYAYVLDSQGRNVSYLYDFNYVVGVLTILGTSEETGGGGAGDGGFGGSGNISTEKFDLSDIDVVRIYASSSETIYLKDFSYGDYTTRGWTDGTPHDLNLSLHPLSFTGFVLQDASYQTETLEIEYLDERVPYLLPYYTVDYLNGSNDVHVSGDTTDIVSYNRLTYAFDETNRLFLSNPQLSEQEALYRQYVYENYLSLPDSTRNAMLDIIQTEGIDPLSQTVISEVQSYIQGAATYNLDFEDIPSGVDIAIYFLTVSKEGICQHYATAATVMFRALGIPARYTTGFIGEAEADSWVIVKGDTAHAWVEIYIDGFGWLPVEVTGGFDGSGGGGAGSGNGNGSGSGDGDGDGDGGGSGAGGSTGGISTEPFELSDTAFFKIYASVSENMYFRDRSWGDYSNSGWSPPVVQDLGISTNPLSFTSLVLQSAYLEASQVYVEYLVEDVPFLVPYHTTDVLLGLNDTRIIGSTTDVVLFNRIAYNYNPLDFLSMTNPNLSSQELLYRTFVYEQYLSLPESTRQAMLQIITDNGIDSNSDTIVSDVQNYIQNAAKYTTEFAEFPAGVDIAIHFLTVSKEGICQHYATAAAVMYRALGIPARYVTGFTGSAVANEWVTVTGKTAHAWVEIYIDGLGWVPIEVTGSGDSSEQQIPITVTPKTVRDLYVDGKTISATEVVFGATFEDYLALGYTYQATFTGALSTPGLGESQVSDITIYDALGNDVTDAFNITYRPGLLQLYLYEITIITNSFNMSYNGQNIVDTLPINPWSAMGTLGVGHQFSTVVYTGNQTNVGTSKNSLTLKIVDNQGVDQSGLYRITYNFGDLVVTPQNLVIESASATKSFDGTPLTADSYTITSGSLASTDTLSITITGSQIGIGSSQNTIDQLVIFGRGQDVTSNYAIILIEGDLLVLP